MAILGLRDRILALHHARREPGWRERLGDIPAGGMFFHGGRDDNLHTFAVVYERARRPDAGAGIYSYMSCAPMVVAPCGPGFDVQGPGWAGLQPPPLYTTQAARVAGIPLQSNSWYGMPLSVPQKSTPLG